MIRVAISVEGPTEEEFSKGVLTTHLRSHGIEAQPILLGRARGRSPSGGNVSVEQAAKRGRCSDRVSPDSLAIPPDTEASGIMRRANGTVAMVSERWFELAVTGPYSIN